MFSLRRAFPGHLIRGPLWKHERMTKQCCRSKRTTRSYTESAVFHTHQKQSGIRIWEPAACTPADFDKWNESKQLQHDCRIGLYKLGSNKDKKLPSHRDYKNDVAGQNAHGKKQTRKISWTGLKFPRQTVNKINQDLWQRVELLQQDNSSGQDLQWHRA